jgi:hypothetical protein
MGFFAAYSETCRLGGGLLARSKQTACPTFSRFLFLHMLPNGMEILRMTKWKQVPVRSIHRNREHEWDAS